MNDPAIDVRDRVGMGAAALDTWLPGWASHIDPHQLQLDNAE